MKFSKHLFANEIKDILLAYVKLPKGICILTLRTERKASRYKHSFDQCKGQFAKAAIIYETRLWIGMYFDDQFGTTSVENTRRRTFSNGIHRKNDAVRLHVRKIGTREASLRGIQSRGHTVENRCQDGNWFYLRDGKLTRDVSTPLFTCGRPCAQTMYRMSMGILEKIRQMAVKAFEEGIKETNSSHAFLRTSRSFGKGFS